MRKTIIITVAINIILISGAFLFLNKKTIRYGVVDSAKLIHEYKNTERILNSEAKVDPILFIQLDSLNQIFKTLTKNATAVRDRKEEHENITNKLLKTEALIVNYRKQISNQETSSQEVKLQLLLDEINSKIEVFAKNNGYHIIIGSTNVGNVVYVEKGLNITDDLIEFVNNYED